MKKILSIMLAMAMMVTLLAGCGGSDDSGSTGETWKVALVIDSTFGTQSFSDVMLAGAQSAADEYDNVELVTAENVQSADAADTYRSLISQGVNMFIVSSGATMELVLEVALEYPDVYFASVDYEITESEIPDNVVCISYREQESSFLNAAFAMLMSETGKIAWFGGNEGGTMVRFEAGFIAGAKYIDPDADISVTYVGFSDVNLAQETATLLYSQGYDWILSTAASSNLGTFAACEAAGDGYWVSGAADGQFHLCDRIICSNVKRVDNVTYDCIVSVVEGTFAGGETFNMGLAEEGVDLLFNTDDEELMALIPDDIMDIMDEIRADIISGKIEVPADDDGVAAFTAVYGE